MMRNKWIVAPALALAVSLSSFATASLAEEVFRLPDFFRMADTENTQTVSRKQFVEAAGKTYDMMVARIKKMPSEKQKQLMKGDTMTKEGFYMFIEDFYKGA